MALALLLLLPGEALALGTPAGDDIVNTVTATYTVGGGPGVPITDTHIFLVDELIDVDVTLQTAGPVPTAPGNTNEVLTFLVTNVGNGIETFRLTPNAALLGDDFDPTPSGVFLDSNGNGVLDGPDAAYVPAGNDPTLDANTPGSESILVFVLNDIPAGPAPNDRGDAQLAADALSHTGAPGSSTAGVGDGGTFAVAGASGGDDDDLGSYLITDTSVNVLKTSAVLDPGGGASPVPGAFITYSLDVTVTGTDTAANVVITDPIPANTTYRPGTLLLNGAPLTDAGDADTGDFNATNPGEVTVGLGALNAASPTQTVSFQVQIN